MTKIKRQDIRLTSTSLAAARQCLEVTYVVGGGVEAALALCAGLRDSCGIENADESMFEGDVVRILYRAGGFTIPMTGFDALKVEKLLDELERIALSNHGVDRIWDSLAATVGDAEPSDADLRVIAIFRALRDGNALADIEPQRSPRPSKTKREAAILQEREEIRIRRETKPLPSLPVRMEDHSASDDTQSQPLVEVASREPGKIACRVLAYLHQGYVLVDREGLPGSGPSTSRLLPARPRFDREENPRYLLEYDEDWKQKHYDRDYGWELEWAGWITQVRGVGDSVFCLTPKGKEAAIRLFGSPDHPISAIDPKNREHVDIAVAQMVSGEIDEDAFAIEVGVKPEDLDNLLDQICWYGDNRDLADSLESWRSVSNTKALAF